ncbi:GH92 family glycosyl hydrolase [Zunongwangia atlantica]|uniref:Glycoside hydrolase family protein n=1 Tax=Zunongwangia atlantica 22II14-10F7 TaxID=1185767 RepID=A0A1Y1T0G1_9FLAO|nr:GH92 family glycosyl hydrolase [Zunongwangia atlantica]ORL44499.1 glycoside hydrolase family protein [Zunongwangia atlantica 22II14-10F7]
MIKFFKNNSLPVLFMLVTGFSSFAQSAKEKSPAEYVNPYMGNISHLLVPTYPTIHMPNSLLRVYPERSDYNGDLLNGLPLIITSHRGSSAFNLSPFQGELSDLKPVIKFSYDLEEIHPYSYHVYLDEQETTVDYGLSSQSAKYIIQFEKEKESHLILNSRNGMLSWDGEAISGYQIIGNNTKIYIYLIPKQKPEKVQVLAENAKLSLGTKAEGRNASIVLSFSKSQSQLELPYGVSFINEQQAKSNYLREVKGKTLAKLQEEGKEIWDEALGKMQVEGGSEADKNVFYTSLYRSYERPVCISEDGRYYSAFDGQVHDDNGRAFYTDDWIWDSYRAHHPLRVLLDPKQEEDIIHSFILMAEQMDHNWLPTFPEVTGDSRRMNSNHGVATILDASEKGLNNFDLEKAFQASKAAITEKTLAPWSGKPAGELDDFYKEHGFIPGLREGEEETIPEVSGFEKRQPVAVTLGTAYDEWCLAVLANKLDHKTDFAKFKKEALNYRNLFNTETKFFHPKDKNGEFITPFDYRFSGGIGARNTYGENNGWTYRWDVQHNVADLIDLMGGREAFVENLDATFAEPMGRGKREFYTQLPDQTGNVGQFSMANEPSLHIPYLYSYAGAPWKTQKRIKKLIHTWFRNDFMGVPGDEDGGGMSSFVVFSQLGFYPVTPGLPIYVIGSPFFQKSEVSLENGNTFTIIAENFAEENKYIQSATLNGKSLDKPWFTHKDLENGGTLVLKMGKKANKNWGSKPENAPPSFKF